MKVMYGWPADSAADINLHLFMQRIVNLDLPDMLSDVHALTQAAPEITPCANFNCCNQQVRRGKPEMAYAFFKTLNADKNSNASTEIAELVAELLENSRSPLADEGVEEKRCVIEFYKLITPHACHSALWASGPLFLA